MRLRTPMTLAVLAALVCSAALAQDGQKKDEQVIDDFVTTRGVSFEDTSRKPGRKPAPPSTRRNRPSSGKGSASGDTASGKTRKKDVLDVKSGQGGGGSEIAAPSAGGGDVQTLKASGAPRPLALGYTILMKDDAGRLFVSDASREFKTGERFAVALETNADGYLYMFSAENGRNPELLFPNARIDGGANAVAAHARATFPTGASAAEEHFIEFTAPAATEHLYIIFSRRPLGEVPAGEALVKFCGANLEDCAWRPTAAQWADILKGSKGRGVTEAKSGMQLAQAAPPPVTPGTLQRGLKVKKEDPKPAIVRVNNSPDADVLVTEIVLKHK